MERTRVIIADDESLVRLDLREALAELGYLVVGEVSDGQSAVNMARELAPDVVVIIGDRYEAQIAAEERMREQVEARNKADQLAYGVEKALEEVKDKLPADKVADVEGKVKSLREAIEAGDTAAMATHSEALEAAMKEIAEVAYSSAAAEAGAAPGGAAPGGADQGAKAEDDVIDAEFEEGD